MHPPICINTNARFFTCLFIFMHVVHLEMMTKKAKKKI